MTPKLQKPPPYRTRQKLRIGTPRSACRLAPRLDCRLPKIILTVVPKIMNPSNDFASPIALRVDKGQFPARPDRELYPTLTRCPQVQPCLSEAMKQGT